MSSLIRQAPRSPSPVQANAPQRDSTTTRPGVLAGAPNGAREMLEWSGLLPAIRRTSHLLGRIRQPAQPLLPSIAPARPTTPQPLPNVAPARPTTPQAVISRPAPRIATPPPALHATAVERSHAHFTEGEKSSVESAERRETPSEKSRAHLNHGEKNSVEGVEQSDVLPTYAQALQETAQHKDVTLHAARLASGRLTLAEENAALDRLIACGWRGAAAVAGGALFWDTINPATIVRTPLYVVAGLTGGTGYLLGAAYGAVQEPSALETLLISDGVAKDRADAKRIIAVLAKENVLQLRWFKSPKASAESASHLAGALSLDRAQGEALDRILWAMVRREQVPEKLWKKLVNAEHDVAGLKNARKYLRYVLPASITSQQALDRSEGVVKSLEDEIYTALRRDEVESLKNEIYTALRREDV